MELHDGDAYWARDATSLLLELKSDPSGLTEVEAKRRLRRYGPNTVTATRANTVLAIFANQFRSVLVITLIVSGAIAVGVGEFQEAVIIWLIVFASCLLSFQQEYSASKAMEQLQISIAHRSIVMRAGQQVSVLSSQVVPGDVVCLVAGVLVPADGVLIDANDLMMSEAALTGEAFPVEKHATPSPANAPVSGRANAVFAGTSVRSGFGHFLTIKTGDSTQFAGITHELERGKPETAFARGIHQFGTLMAQIVFAMVIIVFATNLALHRPLVDSLLFSIALGVGMTPELLPAIVSATLSLGAHRLAGSGVLVRRLTAIENLGSMNVLCTDKTGTLTEGIVKLHAAVDTKLNNSTEVLLMATVNARLQSGLPNPLDNAILSSAQTARCDTSKFRKLGEIPYDFSRRRLTVATQQGDLVTKTTLVCKGAVNEVLAICDRILSGSTSRPISSRYRKQIDEQVRKWSVHGYRVLALAVGRTNKTSDFDHGDEQSFTLAGFLLFQDAPKPGVGDVIAALRRRGIRTCIVTGDNRHAAAFIAEQVGLPFGNILTGKQMMQLTRSSLTARVSHIDIFAELDPGQKEQVILALRRKGRIVGFLGDGINDAPALQAADVGVSVDTAVDVAREAADVVILQKNLAVLLRGVEDGRRIFANTMKYITTTMSANFGNMASMAAASVVLPFLPLQAKQILLNNFLSDVPSLTIATDNVDDEDVTAPHSWDIARLRKSMVLFGLTSSVFDVITFMLLLYAFHAQEAEFQTTWFLVSLVTEICIVFVLRTRRPFWASAASPALFWSSLAVLAFAFAIPFLPHKEFFGFAPISFSSMIGTLLILVAYVAVSEAVKRRIFQPDRRRF